jgi:hypothetical protein
MFEMLLDLAFVSFPPVTTVMMELLPDNTTEVCVMGSTGLRKLVLFSNVLIYEEKRVENA